MPNIAPPNVCPRGTLMSHSCVGVQGFITLFVISYVGLNWVAQMLGVGSFPIVRLSLICCPWTRRLHNNPHIEHIHDCNSHFNFLLIVFSFLVIKYMVSAPLVEIWFIRVPIHEGYGAYRIPPPSIRHLHWEMEKAGSPGWALRHWHQPAILQGYSHGAAPDIWFIWHYSMKTYCYTREMKRIS